MTRLVRILTILFIPLITLNTFGQSRPEPCTCCSEEYRQFDFWVGEWDVFTDGKLVGRNSISMQQDSCLIQENWISGGGNFTGTSYNYYNARDQKWKQLWIDNQGGSLELTGYFNNHQMILTSEKMTNRNGETVINRIIWTPNSEGTVRQLWESSKDDGKTWETVFNGLYKKREP